MLSNLCTHESYPPGRPESGMKPFAQYKVKDRQSRDHQPPYAATAAALTIGSQGLDMFHR